MYKADSKIAEEFIDHQEILDTLEYAHNNKSNRALIEQLIDKAAQFKGLSHREAALLLVHSVCISFFIRLLITETEAAESADFAR